MVVSVGGRGGGLHNFGQVELPDAAGGLLVVVLLVLLLVILKHGGLVRLRGVSKPRVNSHPSHPLRHNLQNKSCKINKPFGRRQG